VEHVDSMVNSNYKGTFVDSILNVRDGYDIGDDSLKESYDKPVYCFFWG